MNGREFLDVARDLATGPAEAHWRSACGRAYYSLFLEGREALVRWGIPLPLHQPLHGVVRLRFTLPPHSDLKHNGYKLDSLAATRALADYRLQAGLFPNNASALQAIDEAFAALVR